MSELLFHPRTAKQIDKLRHEPPQSLLISGPVGVGLKTAAQYVANGQLIGVIKPTNSKDEVDEMTGTISVDVIRELHTQTRSKRTERGFIIIDNAERMNSSAQSAFLKLLEEPQPQIHFILTSHQPQLLKSTILSRVQTLAIAPLTPEQSVAYLDTFGVDDLKKRAQLSFIAPGLPAEAARLMGDADYFEKKAGYLSDARTFLQATMYERLLVVNKYASDRPAALALIDGAIAIIRHTVSSQPSHAHITQLERLLDTRQAVSANGSIKLHLTNSVVQ